MVKKLLIAAVLLAVCAVVWFVCMREKSPAAAETQEASTAEAAAAAEFVVEFRAALTANDMGKLRKMCDNPKSEGLREQFELLRNAELPEQPELVEFRTARSDSWSLYYPAGDETVQIVLRRLDDGSFRFKKAYR